ncbi:type II toxin-antitoxin system ParD family antitoxin [uncultured Tistrella sp.]|uniref:ribbon-helix-helix domain-containing protein n=1 Tax=Tistrella mobilis TaxID=171437 RepID=UPI000C0997EE|nr:type II toxin-antitoxin system ParD family antitoxin [uncultured Tistrella sp.]MAM77090.1 type II toxin-antitoxin system ParD family antitoxin [Tistrella sp.]
MAGAVKRSIGLSPQRAAFVDRLLATGAYADVDEVIDAGLRALQDQDAEIERWLREDVAPVYDAVEADPGRVIPVDDAFDRLRALHANCVKAGK